MIEQHNCYVSDCKETANLIYAVKFDNTDFFPVWCCQYHSMALSGSWKEMTSDELLIYNILND